MRFDLTCNMTLRTAIGQDLQVRALPAHTSQQQPLHEVLWVDGCERWTVTSRPDGGRVLDLVGCHEVRVAFAVSLTVAPVWCHAAALWAQPDAPMPSLPRGYSQPGEQWSVQRITAALGRDLRGSAAVFAALPELFEWLHATDASTLRRSQRVPRQRTQPADSTEQTPELLQLAIAVFRTLGVPARIAVGFAPESESLDGRNRDARTRFLELYAGGRWWLFDPNGHAPACGFLRTAVGSGSNELELVQGTGPVQTVRMDASVDPPPAWGLPSTSSRLLLSLDAPDTAEPLSSRGEVHALAEAPV